MIMWPPHCQKPEGRHRGQFFAPPGATMRFSGRVNIFAPPGLCFSGRVDAWCIVNTSPTH